MFFYRFCVLAEALKMEVVDVTDVESLSYKINAVCYIIFVSDYPASSILS